MSYFKKSSDRPYVPTSRDNFNSDHFPFSSQSPRRGNSSFNSTRDKILHNLSEFEDQLPSNKMFVDRSPFGSSFDHPRMMPGSRNLDMSNSFRDEMDDQVTHHPRVFNIPIQVETPEGFVPLVRSSSNRGNMTQLKDDASDFPCGSPSERSRYIQRPVKSPTPPPKPKFIHNHHQPYQHNPEPYSHSHPRVHSIPVKIERSFNPQQPANSGSSSPQPFDEVSHPASPSKNGSFFGGRRSRSSSESESHQPDACRAVNIPIQIVKTQSNEPQSSEPLSAPAESNQTVNPPKPRENKEKTPPDPLELIKEIEQEACRLEKEVIDFNGEYLDKKYRYLDEMLTRCMLKLDSIDSNGRDEVRMARRSTLAHVDHCVAILEGKVNKPRPEENIDEMPNQCDEQTESATMEAEPIQQGNEETTPNESTACEMSEEPKNEMMETENNSDLTNINSVDVQELKSTTVTESVNVDELNCKIDEGTNDQLDVETSSADSTRVNLDDTAHNSQIDQMSQDIEVNEFDSSPEPKVEFPPDSPDEMVDKEMNIETKESPDSKETVNDQEQSTGSNNENLVNEEKSSNNESPVKASEARELDYDSSPIEDDSIEKQDKAD